MVSTRKNQSKLNGEDKTEWINSIKTPVPIIVVARQGFVNTNGSLLLCCKHYKIISSLNVIQGPY